MYAHCFNITKSNVFKIFILEKKLSFLTYIVFKYQALFKLFWKLYIGNLKSESKF